MAINARRRLGFTLVELHGGDHDHRHARRAFLPAVQHARENGSSTWGASITSGKLRIATVSYETSWSPSFLR